MRRKPHGHLRWLHGGENHTVQRRRQIRQIDLVAKPNAEILNGPPCVVAGAVEAAIDGSLNASPSRAERRCGRQRGHRDQQV